MVCMKFGCGDLEYGLVMQIYHPEYTTENAMTNTKHFEVHSLKLLFYHSIHICTCICLLCVCIGYKYNLLDNKTQCMPLSCTLYCYVIASNINNTYTNSKVPITSLMIGFLESASWVSHTSRRSVCSQSPSSLIHGD